METAHLWRDKPEQRAQRSVSEKNQSDTVFFWRQQAKRFLRTQTSYDVSKALAVSQLYERHAEVSVETMKSYYIPFALVALHATPVCMHWKVVGKLG